MQTRFIYPESCKHARLHNNNANGKSNSSTSLVCFFCFVICIVIEILLLKFDFKIKPLLVIHDDGTLYAFVHGESDLVKQPFASVVRIQSIPVRSLIL